MEPMSELPDFETAYRAVQGRDPRFDGRLYLGVTSTGIYCRPVLPGADPQAGERPLLRRRRPPQSRRGSGPASAAGPTPCRAAGAWDHRATWSPGRCAWSPTEPSTRAASPGWPRSCTSASATCTAAWSRRSAVGAAGARQDAAARRPPGCSSTRPTSSLTDVAFAAGFASVRQFNDVMLARVRLPAVAAAALPAGRRRDPDGRTPGRGAPLVLRLVHREPYAVAAWLRWQDAHAVAGLEEVDVGHVSPGRPDLEGAGRRRADAGVGAPRGPPAPRRPRRPHADRRRTADEPPTWTPTRGRRRGAQRGPAPA